MSEARIRGGKRNAARAPKRESLSADMGAATKGGARMNTLTLRGELSDDIPDCMSAVIGRWISITQDAMPEDMRNISRWKAALVRAAGTGRQPDDEMRRLDMILTWLWETALPVVQPIADAQGFGEKWHRMCSTRSEADAERAAMAAAEWATRAVWAEEAEAAQARAAVAAAEWAETTATTTARAAMTSATAARWAAATARAARAVVAASGSDWDALDPVGLLERLVAA